MLRRVKVQPDNVRGFGFEIRIVAGHVALQAVRLQAGLFPHPRHSVLADAQCCGKLATTPVSGTVLRLLAGSRENPGSQLRSQHGSRLSGMTRIQAVHPRGKEALLPADDGRGTRLQSPLDGVEGSSLGQHQDELGAKNVTRRQGTRLSNAAKFYTLVRGEGDFATCRHTNLEA